MTNTTKGSAAGAQKPQRQARQEHQGRVRLAVSGRNEILERYAANLSSGGLFIRDTRPPPVGTQLVVEFVLPDGSPLCRLAAEVVHSRPDGPGPDRIPGMGLAFTDLDDCARDLLAELENKGPAEAEQQPAGRGEATRVSASDERAPLIGPSGPVIGIDLGTVNSSVAIVENAEPVVLTSEHGYEALPSVLYQPPDKPPIIGHKAAERMILQPQRAVYGSKRFLGRPFGSKEVRTMGHFFAYTLVADESGRTAAQIDDQTIKLEEVAAKILGALKQMAEHHLGQPVRRAVITVPAYFGAQQRQAVRDAAQLAGLYPERLVNEPTAAAVAFGRRGNLNRNVLVYDLGGGTFDATLVRVQDDTIQVLGTDGDAFLGGADFDDRLVEYVMMSLERREGLNLRDEPVAVQRIRFAAELAKRQLSDAPRARIEVPYLAHTDKGPLNLSMVLDREMFERLTQDLVDRTLETVQTVLTRAGLRADDLDDVVMVGGQSRSPHIRRSLQERFNKKPVGGVHPDAAVALGAALVAEGLSKRKPFALSDVLPHSLRALHGDGTVEVLLHRNARLPARAQLEARVVDHHGTPQIRLELYSGESDSIEENAYLGGLELPASLADAVAGTRAAVSVNLAADGVLSATMKHPRTGATEQLLVGWNKPAKI